MVLNRIILHLRHGNPCQDMIDAELVPTLNVVERFRELKTPEEIQKLRVSCDIASRAFDKILQDIKVGVTEKELASKLSHYMVMEGADTKPYGGILISGPKTSLLHGIPGNQSSGVWRFRIDGLWMSV